MSLHTCIFYPCKTIYTKQQTTRTTTMFYYYYNYKKKQSNATPQTQTIKSLSDKFANPARSQAEACVRQL